MRMQNSQPGNFDNRGSTLLFGPDGLRAGWGILLFCLLLSVAWLLVGIYLNAQHLLHPDSAAGTGLFGPASFLVQALTGIATIVTVAILFGSGGGFTSAKTAATVLLMACSVALVTTSIAHSVHQKQKAEVHVGPDAMTEKQQQPASFASQPGTSAAAPKASSEGATRNQPATQKKPQSAMSQELGTIVSEVLSFALILLVTWIMSRIERRSFGQYGLGGNSRRWPQFAAGLVAGFGSLSLLIALLAAGNWIRFDGVLLHSAGPVFVNGILWLLGFTAVGFFEEFFFRGYLQYTLARGIGRGAIGFFLAAALFNFGFGFAHGSNPGESPFGLINAGLIGFVFCIALWYTRSLWWAIGFHATWDWGESFFYGTADSGGVSAGRLFDTHPQGSLTLSGGPTGPEGSVLATVIVLMLAAFIWLTLRREHSRSTNQALINPILLQESSSDQPLLHTV